MNKEQEKIRKKSPVNIRNKKASFEYFFIEEYTAGIVLTGTEIKSIRLGKASLVDTFCYINNGEIWVKGMNISPYFYGSYNNHEAKRYRKLLQNVQDGKVFEKDEAILWQCRNCGFVIESKKAPVTCPACAHPQAYFEPMKQNY